MIHRPRLRNTSLVGTAVAILVVLILTGCRTPDIVETVPFGDTVEVGPLTFSSRKTGEGAIAIEIASIAPEPLTLTVNPQREDIGFDYSRAGKSKSDKTTYSKFDPGYQVEYLDSDSQIVLDVVLSNWYQITRDFDLEIRVDAQGVAAGWQFIILVRDVDFYVDPQFLWKLNRQDYWHPTKLEEAWREYERHIGL